MKSQSIVFPELVLVTGAAGAVGSELCRALFEQGVGIVATDRRQKPVELTANDKGLVWVQADLESPEERANLVETVRKVSGRSLGIVHNASFVGTSEISGWNVPLELQSTETWRRAIDISLTAPFSITRDLSPELQRSLGSAVVNVSSIYSSLAPDWTMYRGTNIGNPAGYGVAKAGLEQLTRWLASALAPRVRVNAVAPGGLKRNQPEPFVERYEDKVPLGRMGTEREIVDSIMFLLSSQSSYVTGQVLVVDGGFGIL